MTLEKHHRSIRSYVLRGGRKTPSQQHALTADWPQYGLPICERKDCQWSHIFGREAKRVLEIGFGMGESFVELAKAHPEIDFIGIEVHSPGVGNCLANARKAGLTNLKIFHHDAKEVLERVIPLQSIDKIFLLFPDPWPKTRHHKRRLVQPEFMMLLVQSLKLQGTVHLATDWQPYAAEMLRVLEDCPVLLNEFGPHQFAPSTFSRLQTKFERRGEKLGHTIFDLVFRRIAA